MNIAFEYWVILGLVGLYLYDSAKLIRYNQVFLYTGLRSKFSIHVPSKNMNVLKKYLFLTHPFHNSHLLFILQWNLNAQKKCDEVQLADEIQTIKNQVDSLRKLQLSNILVWILTLIAFPLLFLTQQSYLLILSTLLLIYVINLAQASYVILKRKPLTLNKKQCVSFFIDALFCPPFALNLLKKITLNIEIQHDAIHIAQLLLNPKAFSSGLEQIIQDIDALKQSEPNTETAQYIQLGKLHSYLITLQHSHNI
ncbi:hypothetical protein [Acinetobacter silvestris]|uniref:Uncharacterized protein n=1 Tax=Acinetobacter silvestris TaxID=1977882 RepID=A0A1Y3CN19_9GAMM|nr:hypothetical protein [Acinetobacter silvestris]OTG67587.1 hypothetical protein B9T28_02900 [Acinetobacter silvestris]